MDLNQTQQRIRWGIFMTLAGLAVLLTILDSTGNLDGALALIRDPFGTVLSWTSARSERVDDLLSGPRDIETAQQEIEQLQARVEALERENEELRELQGEYQILLELFNRARETPTYRRVTAAIIGQDSNPGIRSIIIDKGSVDGVRVGMPVESARGLVGQVFRTTPNSAQVVLVTENSSAVPSRLGSSRATGILRGSGVGNTMTIDWIDLRFQVEVGETVLTSGLGGRFPQDLVIGRVIDVNRSEADLFQQAVIQSAVDFEALEIVFVIVDFEPIDTDIFSTSPGG